MLVVSAECYFLSRCAQSRFAFLWSLYIAIESLKISPFKTLSFKWEFFSRRFRVYVKKGVLLRYSAKNNVSF